MQLLASAVERRVHGVIAVGEDDERREVLIRFMSEDYDPEAMGYWVHVYEGDNKLIDKLIKSKGAVTVSLQNGGAKIWFESVIVKRRRQNLVQRQVLVQQPEDASVLEHRSQPREWVPERLRLAAVIRAMSPGGKAVGVSNATIWDLGQQGASIIARSQPFLEKLKDNAPLQIQIRLHGEGGRLTFAATHRHTVRISAEKLRLGIQFQFADDKRSKHDRECFTALMDELHKANVRDGLWATLHHDRHSRNHGLRPTG
jgi:hypothetical protein